MNNPASPEHLINQITDLVRQHLPQGLGDLGQDLRHNLKALVSESMARMDLVSREEFEIQKKVLQRTRANLTALQEQLQELEQLIAAGDAKE